MIIKNVNIATPPEREYVVGNELDSLDILTNQDIEIHNGTITGIQPSSEEGNSNDWAIPAFTDPHTHLVFCGSRENEVDLKKSLGYDGILKAGGGIYSTVSSTRSCDIDSLYLYTKERIIGMMMNGTSALECKTGYGLDLETEDKSLKVLERLERDLNITIKKTLLAHVPPRGSSEGTFIRDFIDMIDEFRKRIDYVDVFVDDGAFTPDFALKAIEFANSIGITGRVHLNEIRNLGGVSKLRGLRIASMDHMVETSEGEISEIESAVTLLPFTALTMGKSVSIFNSLKDGGIIISIGSDSSPNTYLTSFLFVISIARQMTKMTLENLLNMATLNSSYSLSISRNTGSIHTGKEANIILTRGNFRNIGYKFGEDLIRAVFIKGKKYMRSETDLSN
ncbi:MAG: amidohydrolase family protein [Thermoplasmatales archaeon]